MSQINRYILFLIIVIPFLIFSNSFRFKIDLTKDKIYSINNASKTILNEIKKPLMIKIYLEGDLPSDFLFLKKYIQNFLFEVSRINTNIDFEFVNTEDLNNEDLIKYLTKKKITPIEIEINEKNQQTKKIVFPGAIIYFEEREKE